MTWQTHPYLVPAAGNPRPQQLARGEGHGQVQPVPVDIREGGGSSSRKKVFFNVCCPQLIMACLVMDNGHGGVNYWAELHVFSHISISLTANKKKEREHNCVRGVHKGEGRIL